MLMTAECLGSEASAAYMMQDPGALALVEGALATCRSLRPVPAITESRLLGVLGGVHTADHRWEAAIKAFEQSVAAGEVVQDLRRLSILYAGLSFAYQELNNVKQATYYAQRAVALELAGRSHAITSIADAHAWLGRVASVRGDDAAADAEFAAAFEVLREPAASRELMSRTYARYADILEARGDIVGAVQQLKRALSSRSSGMALEAGYATA